MAEQLSLPVGAAAIALPQDESIEQYSSFTLTADQQRASKEIFDWLGSSSQEYLLEGFAGTGKTTLNQLICSFLKRRVPDLRIGMCAYSNCAKKVVQRVNRAAGLYVDTMTCCQMLGALMAIDAKGKVKFRPDPDAIPRIENYDLIIVDEAYGLDSQMYEDFKFAVKDTSKKILYVGDPAQTGPIGELYSPVHSIKSRSRMTEVRRHDGAVLDYATAIRQDMEVVLPYPESSFSRDQRNGLWVRDQDNWLNIIGRAFKKFHEKDPWERRVFCYTNNRVEEINSYIRSLIYEGHNLDLFMPDERITFRQPYNNKFSISDEGTVVDIDDVNVSVHNQVFQAYRVTIAHDDESCFERTTTSEIYVLAEPSFEDFKRLENRYIEEAKAYRRPWGVLYDLRSAFAWVDYAYSLTIHKGKGSTCADAFVDVNDARRRLKFISATEPTAHVIEYNRLVYTAVTRASDRCFIGI